MCGEAITFKELTIAMNTLVINKSPGIDEFPVNFSKHFWDTLGHDFLDVVLFSYRKVNFPYRVDVQICLCYQKVAIIDT